MEVLEKEEQKIKEQFDNLDIIAFDEKFAKIEARLDTASPQKKRPVKWNRIMAIAASFVIVALGALMISLSFLPDDMPRYGDQDLQLSPYKLEDLYSLDNLYLPDFNILIIDATASAMAQDKETGNDIYFSTYGYFDDGVSFREIQIYIIFEKGYSGNLDTNYNNLSDNLTVADKNIKYSSNGYIEPFYSYYLSYTISGVRYYFDYKTIDENDLSAFFNKFLK